MRWLVVMPALLAAGVFIGAAVWFFRDQEDIVPVPSVAVVLTPRETVLITAAPSVSVAPPVIAVRESIAIDVPFAPQAPFGQWNNPIFQDGCEEASIIMAMRWVQGQGLTYQEAAEEIVAISGYEQEKTGNFHDTSAADTAQLMRDYFEYDGVTVRDVRSISDVYTELAKGNILIVPMDGRALKNPHFTAPGPERHMLVVTGYDADAKEFITNDPGTRVGEGYRYDEDVLFQAIRDYPTGNHLPITAIEKRMIVVQSS